MLRMPNHFQYAPSFLGTYQRLLVYHTFELLFYLQTPIKNQPAYHSRKQWVLCLRFYIIWWFIGTVQAAYYKAFNRYMLVRVRVISHLYSILLWDEPIARDAQIWPMIARDHTVLPATHSRTIPAFTPQPQGITALWLVLIVPTHGGMTRLSWPGWLVIYWDRFSSTGSWTLETVTHPSNNRARRWLTSLTETNALTI